MPLHQSQSHQSHQGSGGDGGDRERERVVANKQTNINRTAVGGQSYLSLALSAFSSATKVCFPLVCFLYGVCDLSMNCKHNGTTFFKKITNPILQKKKTFPKNSGKICYFVTLFLWLRDRGERGGEL